MTLTLLGRWQTRLLLLAVFGALVSIPFAIGFGDFVFFVSIFYVALFGVGWDILYNHLQTFRWDHDWPAAFQLLAGIWEAVFLIMMFAIVGLPGFSREMPISLFLLHYSFVWLAVFTASQTLMRVVFPRWRFQGGQWW
ncbi:hypothetical protein IFO70_14110 [Phormidium tenue FACHB-886]|nr:hypothetical protein [Phormidium tenue FACHB-886]